MDPKGPKSAWITSPAAMLTGRVKDPASRMCPGSSMISWRASRLASHTMPMAGWPITAADTPDSSMTPFLEKVAAHNRASQDAPKSRVGDLLHLGQNRAGEVGLVVDDHGAPSRASCFLAPVIARDGYVCPDTRSGDSKGAVQKTSIALLTRRLIWSSGCIGSVMLRVVCHSLSGLAHTCFGAVADTAGGMVRSADTSREQRLRLPASTAGPAAGSGQGSSVRYQPTCQQVCPGPETQRIDVSGRNFNRVCGHYRFSMQAVR
jgi:hypothetical protein